MSNERAGGPLDRPLPWLAIGAATVLVTTVTTIVVGAIINRLVNNACVGECLLTTDTTIQAHMAVAAWSVLIVSAISGAASLYLIWRTLQAAIRSAKAAEETIAETRQIGEAQVRAYLIVTGASLEVTMSDEFRVVYAFRNSGETPASRVWIDVAVSVQHLIPDIDRWVEIASIPSDYNTRSDIAGQTDSQGYTTARVPTLLIESGEAGLWAQPMRVIVTITLGYLDVFGRKHAEPVHYGCYPEGWGRGDVMMDIVLHRQLRADGRMDFDVFD